MKRLLHIGLALLASFLLGGRQGCTGGAGIAPDLIVATTLKNGVRLTLDNSEVPTERMADRLLIGKSSFNTNREATQFSAGTVWVHANGKQDGSNHYDVGVFLKTVGEKPLTAEMSSQDFDSLVFTWMDIRQGHVYQRASFVTRPGRDQALTTGADEPAGSTRYAGRTGNSGVVISGGRISGVIEAPIVIQSGYAESNSVHQIRYEFDVKLPEIDASQVITPIVMEF